MQFATWNFSFYKFWTVKYRCVFNAFIYNDKLFTTRVQYLDTIQICYDEVIIIHQSQGHRWQIVWLSYINNKIG